MARRRVVDPFSLDLLGFVGLAVLVGVDDEVLALHTALRQRCDHLGSEQVLGRGRVVVGVIQREPARIADAFAISSDASCAAEIQPNVPPSM